MPRTTIAEALRSAAERLRERGALSWTTWPDGVIDAPREAAFGDYAANTAMLLAREARRSPLAIAQALAAELADHPAFASVEAAAPGFLNVRLAGPWLEASLRESLAAGPWRGRLPLQGLEERHFRLSAPMTDAAPGELSALQARVPRVGASLVALSRLSGHPTHWEVRGPLAHGPGLALLGVEASAWSEASTPAAELTGASPSGYRLEGRSTADATPREVTMRALAFECDGVALKAAEWPGVVSLAATVGADALGFALLARPANEGLTLDLARLGRESVEEPGFAIYYAIRRARSLLGVAPEGPEAWGRFAAGPRGAEERELLLAVSALPDEALLAAKLLDPARFVRHLERLAGAYHRFAARCRLVGEPLETSRFRAALTLAAAEGLEAGLRVGLGLGAPAEWEQGPELTEKNDN